MNRGTYQRKKVGQPRRAPTRNQISNFAFVSAAPDQTFNSRFRIEYYPPSQVRVPKEAGTPRHLESVCHVFFSTTNTQERNNKTITAPLEPPVEKENG